MMQSFFSRLLWAFILLVFQGLVFNHIHFFGYATPVIYVYILCLQPLNTSRYAWLLWGFAVGLGADFFSETPGLGAASMTLTALCGCLRPKTVWKTWCRATGRWEDGITFGM